MGSIILRRAASSASSLALRSAGTRAQNIKALNVHDHGRLSRELCAGKMIPLSCRYLSSDAKKTSVEDTNRFLIEIIESTKKESDENTKKGSLEDTKKLSAEEKDILEIVGTKICALESMHTINKIDGFPFTVEDGKEKLAMRRLYENEVIHVKISNYVFDSGMDFIPMVVEVCKEGRLSLVFGVSALPKAIQITSFFIATRVISQGQVNHEASDFSIIDSKLREAFLKYLDVRGINTTVFNSIRKHINQKRDSLVWLENLKKFIEM